MPAISTRRHGSHSRRGPRVCAIHAARARRRRARIPADPRSASSRGAHTRIGAGGGEIGRDAGSSRIRTIACSSAASLLSARTTCSPSRSRCRGCFGEDDARQAAASPSNTSILVRAVLDWAKGDVGRLQVRAVVGDMAGRDDVTVDERVSADTADDEKRVVRETVGDAPDPFQPFQVRDLRAGSEKRYVGRSGSRRCARSDGRSLGGSGVSASVSVPLGIVTTRSGAIRKRSV